MKIFGDRETPFSERSAEVLENPNATSRIDRIMHMTAARENTVITEGSIPAKRKWTINGDFVGLRPHGVARYACEVTQAIDRLVAARHPLTEDLDISIVAPKAPDHDFALKSICVKIVPEFDKPRLPQLWVQAQLPRHVEGGLLSFCNLAPVSVRRQIVCIHDLHTRLMPESYGWLFRTAHKIILPLLGKRVRYVTTVSQLSASHLVRYGIAPRSKVVVTYNGADHAKKWDARKSAIRSGSAKPYVFCLGRRQQYKNVELMLKLAPLLDRMGIDLWMAGDVDIGGMTDCPAIPNLRLLGQISDDDFRFALEGALCFIFPSRIEGFGLPGVEAMALGCPVIASTSPCLPEICGSAALYADPDDVGQWADAVRAVKDDTGLRQNLIDSGLEQASKYQWNNIAETYLKLMAQIDTCAS